MLPAILADLPVPATLAVLVGGGVAVYGVVWYERARAMQRWPSVPGVVSQAVVEKFVDNHGGPEDPSQTHYRAAVAYDYIVAGREYRARRVALAQVSASWRAPAEAKVARYPHGRAVTVYYDPEKPSEAILERESAPAWAATLLGAGLLTMCVGVAWGILA